MPLRQLQVCLADVPRLRVEPLDAFRTDMVAKIDQFRGKSRAGHDLKSIHKNRGTGTRPGKYRRLLTSS